MATSLQKQLEKLAVPQTSILLQRKEKASLLFDPKEAANLERENVFAIGLNGLEELKLIDPSFSRFEATLFSENSKYFERAVQTKELNNTLDKNINSFLTSVSPFLLLRPSHKALEWLIHRFHIHEYNVDSLLKCILPYHETKLFVRIIQLINLTKPSNKWHWLEPLQKSRLPLSKKELIKHCAKDLGFMTFICDMLQNLRKIKDNESRDNRWNLLVSFFVSTVVGALRLQPAVEINTIAVLLPNILKGLETSWPLLENSSLMIVAQLLHLAQFSGKLLEPLVKRIIEIKSDESSYQRIMCLNLIVQTQNKKHERLIKGICKPSINKTFILQVAAVSHKYEIQHFLTFLFHHLIATVLDSKNLIRKQQKKKKKNKAFPFFKIAVSKCKVDSKFCVPLIKYIFQCYVSNHQQIKRSKIKLLKKTHKLLKCVNKKCSHEMDQVLEKCLEKFSKEEQVILYNLFNPMKSTDSQSSRSRDTSLYLRLNNPIQISRILAIGNLLSNINKYEEEFVQKSLLERLKEDNPKILNKLLSASQILIEVLPGPELLESITSILSRKIKGKKQGSLVIKAALSILCTKDFYLFLPENLKDKVFYILLPFLHPIRSSEVEFTKLILQSDVRQYIPYITKVSKGIVKLLDKKEALTKMEIRNLNIKILKNTSQLIMISKKEDEVIRNLINCIQQKSKLRTKLQFIVASLISLVLCNLEDQDKLIAIAVQVLGFAEVILSNKKHLNYSGCDELPNNNAAEYMEICLEAVKQRKFPVISVAHCLRTFLTCIKPPSQFHDSIWFLRRSEVNQVSMLLHLQIKMFMLLTDHLSSSDSTNSMFKITMEAFFKVFYNTPHNLLNILSFIWACCICPEDERIISLSRKCQIRVLNVTSSVLKLCDVDEELSIKSKSIIIPLFLISLRTSLTPVRQLTLNCVEHIKAKASKKSLYSPLISKLSEHASEIEADHRQVTQIIAEVFENNSHSQILDRLLETLISEDVFHHIRAGLLQTLRLIKSEKLFSSMIPCALSLINKTSLTTSEKIIVECVLHMFGTEMAPFIASSPDLLKFLLNALQKRNLSLKKKSCQEVALKQVSKEFFLALPSESQKVELLDGLINVLVSDTDSHAFALVNKTFRKVSVNGELLVLLLKSYLQKPVKTSLRQRKNKSLLEQHKTSKSLAESEQWNRIIVVLEAIQSKKKIKNIHLLIPELCGILQHCIEMENQEPLEYSKQLVLLCLYHCFYTLAPSGLILESSGLNENDMNLELVVQCLRVSQNPQTHNYALHLLAFAAKLFPEHVVHNAMAIFTFMGASIVRQDDAYSFQVVIRTIEAIVPAILKGSEENKKSKEETQMLVITIIRIFVDALSDIPEHRRLPVFSSLLHTVDSEMFLWVALALLFEHYVTKWSKTSDAQEDNTPIKKSQNQTEIALQFALQLSEKFPAPDQIKAVTYLVHFLVSLPTDKEQGPKYTVKTKKKNKPTETEIRDSLFNVDSHSSKELRHFKFSILSYLSALFNREALLKQLSEVSDDVKLQLADLYEDLLKNLLFYLKRTSYLVEENALKPSSKFWRAIMHRIYDILEKVNFLLPSQMFVKIINNLLKSEQLLIKRKSLELLNSKLQHHPEAFEGQQVKFLLEIIDPLLQIIKISQKRKEENSEDIAITCQTAFMSLKLIARLLGPEHLDKSKLIMSEVIAVFVCSTPPSPVCASALVCLAELCSCLKAHTIPFLSKFMPYFLQILLDLETLLKNDLLLLSAVSVVHKLVERLPNFLSPYFKSLLYSFCIILAVKDDNPKGVLTIRLKAILHNLATKVPSRVLLPSVQSSYEDILAKSPKAVKVLMSILNEFLQSIEKDDLQSHLPLLLAFFLNALDYRDEHPKNSLAVIASVEDAILDPFLSMVLKLSEVTFRPVFFKVFDWAVTAQTSKSRVITFYRMTNKIADKLKSLFVLFAGHFVKNAANLLDENNSLKGSNPEDEREIEEACLLIQNVLDCLYKCFLYDNESFVTKERFDTLLQPLVDQIENLIGDNSVYEERIDKYLSPCIAHLATAVANDALWKQLNYQILLKTRHYLPMVRCGALKIIEALSKRLGEDYMTLLPETIPFLAEMMEDESEEVEQKCQMLLTELEKTLGEPLQKYF